MIPLLLAGVLGFGASIIADKRVVLPFADNVMRQQLHEYVALLDGVKPPLTDSAFEDLTALEWRRSIRLEAHECVMLGLSASSSSFVLRLQVPSVERSGVRNVLSYCAEGEATHAEFVATFALPPGRIYYEEHRATALELNQYSISAGYLDADYLEARWPRELLRRVVHARDVHARDAMSNEESLSGPHRLGADNAALLLPSDAQMMRVLHESAFLGLSIRDDVDFGVQTAAGEVSGHIAPSVRVDGSLQPLLVAIDPRENAFCTIVEVWPTRAQTLEIGSITHPGAVVTPNVGNRVTVCPQDGTTLIYATSATYDVFVRRGQDAEPQPRSHIVMTISHPLRDFLAECEADEAGACQQAAYCYENGVGTASDLTKAGELIERACTLEAGHCLEAARHMSGTRQHAALHRACGLGRMEDACAILAARYRLGEDGPVNYAYAHAMYQRACELGTACDEVGHMIQLQLSSDDERQAAVLALGFNNIEAVLTP